MKKIYIALFALFALAWPSSDSSRFSPRFVDQLFAKNSGKDDVSDDGNNGKGNDDKEDKDKKDKDPKDPPTVPEPSAALMYGTGAVALLAAAYFLSKKRSNA